MAKYLVKMTETIQYEVYVEAINKEEAEEKAVELYCNGDKDVEAVGQWFEDVKAEEVNEND